VFVSPVPKIGINAEGYRLFCSVDEHVSGYRIVFHSHLLDQLSVFADLIHLFIAMMVLKVLGNSIDLGIIPKKHIDLALSIKKNLF